MLIGTSFGGCLRSILSGEVSEDDVLLIIARTQANTLENVINLAERYYREGNRYASVPSNYKFDESINLEHVRSLAARLYLAGKIHQPRMYEHGSGFIHPEMSRAALWMEVSPININKNPSVVKAYEHYLMLDKLTKEYD